MKWRSRQSEATGRVLHIEISCSLVEEKGFTLTSATQLRPLEFCGWEWEKLRFCQSFCLCALCEQAVVAGQTRVYCLPSRNKTHLQVPRLSRVVSFMFSIDLPLLTKYEGTEHCFLLLSLNRKEVKVRNARGRNCVLIFIESKKTLGVFNTRQHCDRASKRNFERGSCRVERSFCDFRSLSLPFTSLFLPDRSTRPLLRYSSRHVPLAHLYLPHRRSRSRESLLLLFSRRRKKHINPSSSPSYPSLSTLLYYYLRRKRHYIFLCPDSIERSKCGKIFCLCTTSWGFTRQGIEQMNLEALCKSLTDQTSSLFLADSVELDRLLFFFFLVSLMFLVFLPLNDNNVQWKGERYSFTWWSSIIYISSATETLRNGLCGDTDTNCFTSFWSPNLYTFSPSRCRYWNIIVRVSENLKLTRWLFFVSIGFLLFRFTALSIEFSLCIVSSQNFLWILRRR